MPTDKKCLLCHKRLQDNQTLLQYILADRLCCSCRRSLKIQRRTFYLQDLKVTCFGVYEGELADALLQYKECMDEALKDIFLFDVKEWISWHYRFCVLLCAPSSEQRLEKRGFQHVHELFRQCGIPVLDCFVKTQDISQKQASLKDRNKIQDHLAFKKGVSLPEKRVILIDDTVTTGNTLLSLQKLIGKDRCKEALCLCAHPKLLAEYDKKRKGKCIY